MSGKEQEPVIEQSDDSKESTVSVPVEEAPIASTKTEEMVPVMPANDIKEELNYLSSKIFSDIREVSIDDLINSDVVEEVSVEDEERYLSTFSDISEKEIISGRVIGMNEKEVLIDIGFKSEGIISRNEFNEDALPEVGEKLDVFLEKMEDESGKTVLSKEKADFFRRWVELRNIHETGEIITGRIVRRIKGGMVVDLNGVQAFLPGSQIDVRPVKDFDRFIDTDLDLRVVKFNEFRKNIVVSHKAILEESLAEKRDELFLNLEVGKVVEGRVKNITDFGVFVDLGGINGLLHITDLSWGRINHPSELIGMDDTLNVKIIDFDKDKRRVSLGLKQLTPHPWVNVADQYPEGTKVNGKVVSMTNYGAFIEIEPGVEGLVHVSEMSWTRHVKNPSEIYALGDDVEAIVLSIDSEEHKISLGAKQLLDDPWSQIEEKYTVGTLVDGKIINLTQFGAFVELEEGIDGLIHVSDFSWTKIIRHPKEIVEKAQEIKVRILEVSRESRRISLGLKQVEEDPWPELVKIFETGKDVEGEIVRILDKGIILQLEQEVEGIIPFGRQSKRQRKELSTKYKIGQVISGVVMEVKPEDKKVIIFVDELSSDVSLEKDDVREFLDNQSEPEGEKIQIPLDDSQVTDRGSELAEE